MQFKNLTLKTWQQFDNVSVDFHDRLTILTGANGAGKSTILKILALHNHWKSLFLATPSNSQKEASWAIPCELNGLQKIVGKITYSDGHESPVMLAQTMTATYSVVLPKPYNIPCFFIPSHRLPFLYQPVQQYPTKAIDKAKAFSDSTKVLANNYQGSTGCLPINFHMKQTLISWMVFGYGNPNMDPQPEYLSFFKDFEKILKILLPPELKFKELYTRKGEIILKCTNNSEFILDAVSGGINSIIDIAWMIYNFKQSNTEPGTIIIDEIENHLHPTLQRSFLSNLLEAFPQFSFIVSTHSPLIVSSVKDSNVYALRVSKNNSKYSVFSEKLDLVNQAKTASEVLDEVLGVSVTIPIWAENKLQSITNKYLFADDMNNNNIFDHLKADLDDNGLGNFFPEAVYNYLKQKND